MQYQESYTQFDSGLLGLIMKTIPESFSSTLKASGTVLEFPRDRELELKLKYDVSEEGGVFSLKVSWDNEIEEADDEETDDEED